MRNLDTILADMEMAADNEIASIATTAIAILNERGTDAWAAFGRAFRSRLDAGDQEEARAQFEDATGA